MYCLAAWDHERRECVTNDMLGVLCGVDGEMVRVTFSIDIPFLLDIKTVSCISFPLTY